MPETFRNQEIRDVLKSDALLTAPPGSAKGLWLGLGLGIGFGVGCGCVISFDATEIT